MDDNKDKLNCKKINVAYAEDQLWFRDSVVELLIQNGFEISIVAQDGDEMIRLLEKADGSPDIFLTDLRMPKMHGFELIRQILKRWPDSKVVMLTSDVETFYVDEARKAGAVAFLHKIIDHKNIVDALREIYDTGTTSHGKL
ncbi:response regulator [Pedobacter endophyticus]|uniref:Response regulator transcription factor n=1 Tax=Pedobacter endophyticus TaxID=2789740 RepID=A0A7U3Q6I2_9SPHI|nr:response regulator transcription factor [Pedobacter endophyticus]QPH38630.1 response regulator transcription factor [Pedobacter endophyticus]